MKHFAWVLVLASGCSSSGTPSEGTGDSGTDATVIDSGGDAASGSDGGCVVLCAGSCCKPGSVCNTDAVTGTESCVLQCTHSSECAAVAPDTCCTIDSVGHGHCALPTTGTACLCATASDCTTALGGPSCAPQATNDVVSGNYVCKPADGLAWDGCQYGYECPTDYSCWGITSTDGFCARDCQTSATCGNPGNACCVAPDAGAICVGAASARPCTGPGACMPCGN